VDRTYGYDQIGNLTYDSSIGTLTYGAGTAGPHAVTSTGAGDVYAYATDGAMTARNEAGPDLQSLFYTADNSMWYELGTASSAVHFYDADGSRVLTNRTGTGTNTSTVTLAGLFERTIDNTTGQVTDTSYYPGADGVVAAMSIDGVIVHAYTNQIGSITATWNTVTGVINHQNYYPYGENRQTDGLDTTLGYTGQRHDPTGLIYYQARYYDPHTGRFTQADTIVPGGGTNPQALNRYSYVNNNPINYNDPTGHCTTSNGARIEGLGDQSCAAHLDTLLDNEGARDAQLGRETRYGLAIGAIVPGDSACGGWHCLAIEIVVSLIPGADCAGAAVNGPSAGNVIGCGLDLLPILGKIDEIIGAGNKTRKFFRDAPNTTRIFRAVEPDELADLASSGQFRLGGWADGLEGKYFWPSRAQADDFAVLATKADMGDPYCVASGCIPSNVLSQIDAVPMDGLGPAYFIPEEYLPLIDDILIGG